jgi:hypothetical protein
VVFYVYTQPFIGFVIYNKKLLFMHKSNFIHGFLLFCLLFTVFQCEESERSIEDDRTELLNFKNEIESIVATSVCGDAFSCEYMAFGSKACGGPQEYLVYSTSIDVDTLIVLVEDYNDAEADFNVKWGVISDCSVLNPPTNVICENNKCVAIF